MSDPLSSGAVSVNGRITAPGDACIPAMDHGFLFGDSVYEVVCVFGGRPVAWPEHLQRLRNSAHAIYMEVPWEDAEITRQVRATVEATGLGDCYARTVVTRGPGPMTLVHDDCRSPTLVVYALPLRRPAPEQLEHGVPIVVPERLRNDIRALSPAAKTGNYLNNLLALAEARRAGGADAVLLNAAGHVTEATTANVFWVRSGAVYTPSLDCGILPGITRALLLDEIRATGLTVHEGEYALEDMTSADEVFLTGTVRSVMPVVTINGRPVADGAPGPVTRDLQQLHARVMERATANW